MIFILNIVSQYTENLTDTIENILNDKFETCKNFIPIIIFMHCLIISYYDYYNRQLYGIHIIYIIKNISSKVVYMYYFRRSKIY